MGLFTLRDPGGGSALRDPTSLDTLRDGAATTTLYEALSDTLAINEVATGRQAMVVLVADVVVFADTTGGGTGYATVAANTLVFTDAAVTTGGGGTQNYTQVSADSLILTTASGDFFNLLTIPLLPPSAAPWGQSQQWNAWVELTIAGEVVASSAAGDFELLGGRLTEDVSRSVSADVSLDLALPAGSALLPTRPGDLLDPHGETVLKVWAGYRGAETLMGLFDLATSPLRLGADGLTISVTGMSFERILARAGFWQVENWASGEWTVLVLARLARAVLGEGLPIGFSPSVEHFGKLPAEVSWKPGDDRLAKMAEIAAAASMEVRFNRLGHLWMRPAPSVFDYTGATASWEFLDGERGTLLSATREASDEESYNGVVIEGNYIDPPEDDGLIYAAWIQDRSSPLYFNPSLGPGTARWGPRPKFIRNEMAHGYAQLEQIARTELAKLSALADTVTVTAPANPGVEIGQYCRLRSDDLQIDATYRAVRVTHDLAGGPLEATLNRARSV